MERSSARTVQLDSEPTQSCRGSDGSFAPIPVAPEATIEPRGSTRCGGSTLVGYRPVTTITCVTSQHRLAINPRYLAEDTDRRAMVGGFKFLRRLFAAPAMAKYVVAEKLPGPGVQSDDELLDYARANGSTVYHASCSCMMGQHAMAVVDDQLRVHGVESLCFRARPWPTRGEIRTASSDSDPSIAWRNRCAELLRARSQSGVSTVLHLAVHTERDEGASGLVQRAAADLGIARRCRPHFE